MTYIKSETGIILPNHPPRQVERDISAEAVMEWRAHLVPSNLTESAKALYEMLLDIQQADISDQQRFDLLFILGPTLNYLATSLQKLCDRSDVSSEHNLLIADLITQLNLEMINNYKVIIDSAIKPRFPNTKLLLSALQKAFNYYDKILFYFYEQHRTPPAGIWANLHSLYAFAVKHRLATRSLSRKILSFSPYDTLETLYKSCLLLSVANPFRIRNDEILNFKFALEKWAPLLQLRPADNKTFPLFVLDLTVDAPPKYAVLNAQYSAHSFFILVNKVTKRITKLLNAQQTWEPQKLAKSFTAAELALSSQLLESLLATWQSISEKAPVRQKMHGHINVCLGINASHWFLEQGSAPSTTAATAPTQTTVETLDMDILLSNNLPLSSTFKERDTAQYQCFSCELIDQSEGGFCLKWPRNVPPQLQCGEIIALERILPDLPSQWSIGTIRWIKHEENHTTLVGVQLLSEQALAVKARFAEALTAQFTVPTLLLPEQTQAHRIITLIAPPLPFKAGNEIEIEHNGESHKVVLKKNYSLSPSYQQFGLEFLNGCFDFPHLAMPEDHTPRS